MRIIAASFVMLLLAVACAQAEYADLAFVVDEAGIVMTDGITDVSSLPLGASENYTTKIKGFWLVNITTTQNLETFVYSLKLPQGAIINFVGGKNARITTDGDHVVIRGSGQDAPLSAVVQYSLGAPKKEYSWMPLIAAVIVLALLWSVVRARKNRLLKATNTQMKDLTAKNSRPASLIEGLPERQQQIIHLLRRANGALTQRQVELALKLPKSSISRNVEALRRRDIIKKAQTGMSNTLVLDEKYK